MLDDILSKLILQYGSMGLFTAYLIYDRQYLLKKLISSFDELKKEIKK